MAKFLVLLKAYRTVIVEAETSEDAEQTASKECTSIAWEIEGWQTEEELKTDADVEKAKRAGAVEVDN